MLQKTLLFSAGLACAFAVGGFHAYVEQASVAHIDYNTSVHVPAVEEDGTLI